MNKKTALNKIKKVCWGAQLKKYWITKNKNYIDIDLLYANNNAIEVFLRPVDNFRRLSYQGIHILVNKKDFEYRLSDAFNQAERDGFTMIHVYCLTNKNLFNKNESGDL